MANFKSKYLPQDLKVTVIQDGERDDFAAVLLLRHLQAISGNPENFKVIMQVSASNSEFVKAYQGIFFDDLVIDRTHDGFNCLVGVGSGDFGNVRNFDALGYIVDADDRKLEDLVKGIEKSMQKMDQIDFAQLEKVSMGQAQGKEFYGYKIVGTELGGVTYQTVELKQQTMLLKPTLKRNAQVVRIRSPTRVCVCVVGGGGKG